MNEIKINETHLVVKNSFGQYDFEIVNEVPPGYEIWNASCLPEEYLPLCRLASIQPFDGAQNVEIETLKAIKCEGAPLMIKASGCGFGTKKKAEAYMRRKIRSPYCEQRIQAALPYMRQIKWCQN